MCPFSAIYLPPLIFSSYSKSGCHQTTFPLPMRLFPLVNLPVTCSVSSLRSTQVNAIPFPGKSRSSATYAEILPFPDLHCCPPCLFWDRRARGLSPPCLQVFIIANIFLFSPLSSPETAVSEVCLFLLLELQHEESSESQQVHSVHTISNLLPFKILFFLILLYPSIPLFQLCVRCWSLSETAGQTRLIMADP